MRVFLTAGASSGERTCWKSADFRAERRATLLLLLLLLLFLSAAAAAALMGRNPLEDFAPHPHPVSRFMMLGLRTGAVPWFPFKLARSLCGPTAAPGSNTGLIKIKARRDETRRDETRRDKTRQDKTREDILCYLLSYDVLCYPMLSYGILCYLMLSYVILCYLMPSYLKISYVHLCYLM